MRPRAQSTLWNIYLIIILAVFCLGAVPISLSFFAAVGLMPSALAVITSWGSKTGFKNTHRRGFSTNVDISFVEKPLSLRSFLKKDYHGAICFAGVSGAKPGNLSHLGVIAII